MRSIGDPREGKGYIAIMQPFCPHIGHVRFLAGSHGAPGARGRPPAMLPNFGAVR